MNKQEMINTITSKLSTIGVFTQASTTSDIEIKTEFVNAAKGSAKKKIEYNALAFFNEKKHTLFLWEMKKEISSGLSFGSSSDSSFQSGSTVFRKVKSVGYGSDGKAYEYDLDMGAIIKTFKEIAKNEGWKFKVVLSKKKASYSK